MSNGHIAGIWIWTDRIIGVFIGRDIGLLLKSSQRELGLLCFVKI